MIIRMYKSNLSIVTELPKRHGIVYRFCGLDPPMYLYDINFANGDKIPAHSLHPTSRREYEAKPHLTLFERRGGQCLHPGIELRSSFLVAPFHVPHTTTLTAETLLPLGVHCDVTVRGTLDSCTADAAWQINKNEWLHHLFLLHITHDCVLLFSANFRLILCSVNFSLGQTSIGQQKPIVRRKGLEATHVRREL